MENQDHKQLSASQARLGSIAVLILFTALIYTAREMLSTLLLGGILIYVLTGMKQFVIARRLLHGVVFFLVFWLIMHAQNLFIPFLFSVLTAYLFYPFADWIEKRKVPRTVAVLIVLILSASLIVLAGAILIPGLVLEIQVLIEKVPEFAAQLYQQIRSHLSSVIRALNIDSEKLQQNIIDEIPARAEILLNNILRGMTGLGGVFSQVLNIILIPVLSFYLLKDYHRIQSWITGFVPKKSKNIWVFYQWRINRILGGYIRGRIIVCSIVGLLTGIGLSIFNIPFAILLGFLTGVFNIIPFIGPYSSLGIAFLTALVTPNPLITMLKIALVYFVVQSLEALVIQPKIVGDKVGLHPAVVIFSVLFFARFFGFWGLLLGVPAAALIKFIIDDWRRRIKWRDCVEQRNLSDR